MHEIKRGGRKRPLSPTKPRNAGLSGNGVRWSVNAKELVLGGRDGQNARCCVTFACVTLRFFRQTDHPLFLRLVNEIVLDLWGVLSVLFGYQT